VRPGDFRYVIHIQPVFAMSKALPAGMCGKASPPMRSKPSRPGYLKRGERGMSRPTGSSSQ
jgi:hypothetical protein